jgi:hypothetical protein
VIGAKSRVGRGGMQAKVEACLNAGKETKEKKRKREKRGNEEVKRKMKATKL